MKTTGCTYPQSRFGLVVYGKLGIAEENSGKLVARVRQSAKSLALENNATHILIDGPPGIGCPAISSVTGADLVVAVTEPTLSGLHDLERLIDLVGQFQVPVAVIINKYDLNAEMTASIEKSLQDKGISVLGMIPFDDAMVHALLEGTAITEFEPEGFISGEIRRM